VTFPTSTKPDGFRDYGIASGDEILWLPGNPGDTYTKDDNVGMGGLTSESSASAGKEGVLILDGDIDKNSVGTVDQTTVCPANTVAFPYGELPSRNFDPVYDRLSRMDCLVPVRSRVPRGTQIKVAKFANFVDDTVVSWTSGTRTIVGTTGHAANDYSNAALVYIYEGPGIGEVNVVEDYVHSSKSLILHRPFVATLTTASKYIVLSGEAATGSGIPLMGRLNAGDSDNLTVNDGANDGEWVVFCDWSRIGEHLRHGQLPVVRKESIYV
jgi:hypothetical protein